jgi:Terminase large subunit, T4likevirus-type, N-terminal
VQLAIDAGIEPDPGQAKLLRERPRRCLLLCSRQSGKTEVAIHLGLWTCMYEPGSLVLIVSPSQRQSQEVFRRLMLAHAKLQGVPELTQESALRAQFANGSRVIALPGSERTTRGYAGAKLIILDEAARVDDDLLAALRPTMAVVGGSLIMLSTPFGKRGEFYRAWTEGEGWTRVRVPASQCPRLSKEFLAEERRELGVMRFSEEYELAFLEPDESVFPTAIIDRAFTTDVRPLWG